MKPHGWGLGLLTSLLPLSVACGGESISNNAEGTPAAPAAEDTMTGIVDGVLVGMSVVNIPEACV